MRRMDGNRTWFSWDFLYSRIFRIPFFLLSYHRPEGNSNQLLMVEENDSASR
jgi:hypothetical protein